MNLSNLQFVTVKSMLIEENFWSNENLDGILYRLVIVGPENVYNVTHMEKSPLLF